MNTMKTYVDQEEFSIPKMLFGLVLTIVWAYFFAFVYGVLIGLSPLVYINFFITCGFAIVLAVGVRIISRLIKNTTAKINLLMGVAVGFFGLYFSWVAYFLYFLDSNRVFENYFQDFLLLTEPVVLIENMIAANEYGMWSIFGVPFKGTILWLIWLLEAGIIVFISTVAAMKTKTMPYSSKQKAWYKKYLLYKDFASIAMQDDFCNALAENCENVIENLKLGKMNHFSRISVYYLEGEIQQYISVENVTRDAEGKKENAVDVIHLMAIKTKEAENLIEKYHAKKQSFITSLF